MPRLALASCIVLAGVSCSDQTPGNCTAAVVTSEKPVKPSKPPYHGRVPSHTYTAFIKCPVN